VINFHIYKKVFYIKEFSNKKICIYKKHTQGFYKNGYPYFFKFQIKNHLRKKYLY